jgi:hypothetical protein
MDQGDSGLGSAQQQPFRLTTRSAIGALLCVMGVVGVSCQGSNCSTAPSGSAQQTLSNDLDTSYFLTNISSQYTPTTYADSAGYHLRVWSDSLRLKLTDSTYYDAGRTSRLDPVSGDELLHNYRLATTQKFTVDAAGKLTLPAFLGGAGVATRMPSYQHAILSVAVAATGKTWMFYPR